jgi:hypothetical protein
VEEVSLSDVLETNQSMVSVQKQKKLHDQMPQLQQGLPIHVDNRPTRTGNHNC